MIADLPGRIHHLGLPCDDGGQDLLLLAIRHTEVVERTSYLRSDLVVLPSVKDGRLAGLTLVGAVGIEPTTSAL
jgi:hypothetical protein